MSKALPFVSSSFSTFSVSFSFAGEASGTSGSKWHANGARARLPFSCCCLHGFCRHHSFWPLYFMSLTRRRLLSVTVNSDGVMHFSTVFFFINVSCDVRCGVVLHEGLLKVRRGFSGALPGCGGGGVMMLEL